MKNILTGYEASQKYGLSASHIRLLMRTGKIKGPHEEYVAAAKSTAEAGAKVLGEVLDHCFAVLGTIKAPLLSARVGVRHITAERITSWQHQARLVCTIPWLRGTHAQILVGAGYYAPHSIVSAKT